MNGDGAPDAICHDSSSGWKYVARNTHRLVRHVWTSTGAFCNGTGDKLHVGDVNGDGRSDLICAHSNGNLSFDFASTYGYFNYGSGADTTQASIFCTHPGAEMHFGDFNGDGATDRLCFDTNDGRQWIEFSNGTNYPFYNPTRDADAFTWCTHSGAELYTGDFDGDGATDLLCHTASSGALDVDLSAGGFEPFGGWTNEYLHEPKRGGATESRCTTASDCGSHFWCLTAPDGCECVEGFCYSSCTEDSHCRNAHEVCVAGECEERFCSTPGSTLTVGDYSGDGKSDFLCTASDGSMSLLRAFAGNEDGHPDHENLFHPSWPGSYHTYFDQGRVTLRSTAADTMSGPNGY